LPWSPTRGGGPRYRGVGGVEWWVWWERKGLVSRKGPEVLPSTSISSLGGSLRLLMGPRPPVRVWLDGGDGVWCLPPRSSSLACGVFLLILLLVVVVLELVLFFHPALIFGWCQSVRALLTYLQDAPRTYSAFRR
jgi:hypothetical protein